MTDAQLNPHNTFAEFVINSTNELAYTAAKGVCDKTVPLHNPLLIHGGIGTGKTHLLQAIGHEVRQLTPRVFYRTSEEFLNGFITASRRGSLAAFRSGIEKIDFLLLDDAQIFAEKPATQKEFLYMLDYFSDACKQIVITADKAPSKLIGISAQLLDRLQGGLIIEVDNADFDLKMQLLKRRAAEKKLSWPDEVLQHLAHACITPRQLKGSMNKIIAMCELTQARPDLSTVRKLIKSPESDPLVTLGMITKAIAAYFDLTPAKLKAKNNSQTIVMPRHIIMFLAAQSTSLSIAEIGRQFGMHHTTVLHGLKKIEEMRDADPSFKLLLARLGAEFQKPNQISEL